MNFINRAIKNVLRRKSKSILLILTFFLIGNLVIIGLGVSNASKSAKVLTRQKMRAVVTYELDYEAIDEYLYNLEDEDEINDFYKNYPRIKIDDVATLLADSRVKTANAIAINTAYIADDSFDYVHLNNSYEQNMSGGISCYIDDSGNEICDSYLEPNFLLKCNYFPDTIEISDGEYTIVDGRFYNQEEIDEGANVALITEELAETNNLKVGDTAKIKIFNTKESYYKDVDFEDDEGLMEFEIIGIYHHTSQITPDNSNYDYCSPYENPSNTILMPAPSYYANMQSIADKLAQWYYDTYGEETDYNEQYIGTVTLLLNDPLDVEEFVSDYETSIKQFMKLNANNEEFNKLAKPLDTLSLYANFIVWLVVINAVVIITLVTALTLKTREYEIGVLLSIGATKLKVILQFFIELALVAAIGFSLAVVSGSIVANKVGQTVLEYQLSSSEVEESEDDYFNDYIDIWDTDYSSEITLDDLVNEYNVSISPLIIMEIYVLGLAIVFISVIIPSIMIMRFNPKKILMNQG